MHVYIIMTLFWLRNLPLQTHALIVYLSYAQRIEYDGNPIFEKDGALLPDSGGTDYRNLAPLPEKRFSSQGMSLPVTIENPVFGSTQGKLHLPLLIALRLMISST